MRFEQRSFIGKDLILAAGLLVEIVRDDDFQAGVLSIIWGSPP
jgi:hypothetical protein